MSAKRQTKDQVIAAQAAQIENLNLVALNSLRERDDTKAEAETLKKQLDAVSLSPEDMKLHARLANILFPEDDPKTLHTDDLAHKCMEFMLENSRSTKWYKDTARQLAVDPCLSPVELAKAIFEAASQAARAEDELEGIQDVAGSPDELKEIVIWLTNSNRTPEEWDRLAELVELLGLSGQHLNYVLASANLEIGLRHVNFAKR